MDVPLGIPGCSTAPGRDLISITMNFWHGGQVRDIPSYPGKWYNSGMDARIKTAMIAASDFWYSLVWPPYQPGTRVEPGDRPLEPGQLVAPALEVAGLQTVQGFMIASERLGPGIVQESDGTGKVLVRWSKAGVATWAERADLQPIDAGRRLVTIVLCDARGHRTLLRQRVALLQHHWTIEVRPENVVRAERSDGLAWTFTLNPVTRAVIASWIYPPDDDDAEALTAAELAAA